MKKKLSVREQLEQLVRETDKNISVTRVSSGRSHNRYHQSANNVLKSTDLPKASIVAKSYGVATNELSSLLSQVQGSLDGLRHEVNTAQTLSNRAGEGIRTPAAASSGPPSRPSSAPRMPRSVQESTPAAISILHKSIQRQQPILIPHALTNSPSPSRYQDHFYEGEGDNESLSFAAHSSVRNEFDATAHVSRALDSKIDEFEKRIEKQFIKAVASAAAPAQAPAPPTPPPPQNPVVRSPSEPLIFLSMNKAENAEKAVSELKAKVMALDYDLARKQDDLDRRVIALQEKQEEAQARSSLAAAKVEALQAEKRTREEFESEMSRKVEARIAELKVQISNKTTNEVRDLSSQLTSVYAPRSELISCLARVEALAQKHDDVSRESGQQSRELIAASSAVTARADTLSVRIDGLLSSVDQIQRKQNVLQIVQQQQEEAFQQINHRQAAEARSLPPVTLDINPAVEKLTRRIIFLEENGDAASREKLALEALVEKSVAAQIAPFIKQKAADEVKISNLLSKVSELEATFASAIKTLANYTSSYPPATAVSSRSVALDIIEPSDGDRQSEASKAVSLEAMLKIRDLEDSIEKINGTVQTNAQSLREMNEILTRQIARINTLHGGVTTLRQNSMPRIELTANEARLYVAEDMCREAISDIKSNREKVEGEIQELKSSLESTRDKVEGQIQEVNSTFVSLRAIVNDLESASRSQSAPPEPDAMNREAVEALLASSLTKHVAKFNYTDMVSQEALIGLQQVMVDLRGLKEAVGEHEAVHKVAISGLEIALGDMDHTVRDQGQDIAVIRRELSTQLASIQLFAFTGPRDASPSPAPPPATTASRSLTSSPPTMSFAASIAAVMSGGDKGMPEQDVSETSSFSSLRMEPIEPRTLTPKPSPLSFSPTPPVASPLVARELALMPEALVPPPTSSSGVMGPGSHVRHTREFTPTPLCEEESGRIEEDYDEEDPEEEEFALPPPPPPPANHNLKPPSMAPAPSPLKERETRESLGLIEDVNDADDDKGSEGFSGGVVFDDDDLLLLPGQHDPNDTHDTHEASRHVKEEEDGGSDFSLDISGEAEKLAFLLSSPAPSRTLPESLQVTRGPSGSPTKVSRGGKDDGAIVGSLDYLSSDQESVDDEEEAAAANERAEAALAKAALTTAAIARAQAKGFEDSDEEVEVFKPLPKSEAVAPTPAVIPRGRYHLTIITGSKNGAGMSDDLHMTLKGSMASHECVIRSREGGKIRFQATCKDQATIVSPTELGAIQSISAWHKGEGFSSSWLLERVIVEHESSNQVWEFGINDWIRGGQGRGPKSYRHGARTPLAMSRENSASSLGRVMLPSPRVSSDATAGRAGGGGRLSDSFDDDEDGFVSSLGLGLPPKVKPSPSSGLASLFSQPPAAPGGGGGSGLVATGALAVPSAMGVVDDEDLADVEEALVLGGGGMHLSIPSPSPSPAPSQVKAALSSPLEPSPGAGAGGGGGKPPLPPTHLVRSSSRRSSREEKGSEKGSEGGALSDFNDSMDSLPGLGGGGGVGGLGGQERAGKRVSSDGGSSLSSLGSLRGGRPVYGEVVDKSPYGFGDEEEEEEEEFRPAVASNYGGAVSSSAGGMRVWDGKNVVSTTIEIDKGPGFGAKGKTGWKNPLAEGDDVDD